MSEYLVHQTRDGDRWDLLAYQYYGDALAYPVIIQANPTVDPTPGILPGGLALRIPVLDETDLTPTPAAAVGDVPWM
jgi:phage tail protein X